MSTAVLFVVLFAMLMVGVPVGFAIGGATMVAMFYFTDMNMITVAQYCYSGINSFTVMAIPFFLLAGVIMSTGGIAARIVDFAYKLVVSYGRTGCCNGGCLHVFRCPVRVGNGHDVSHRQHDDSRDEEKGLRCPIFTDACLLFRNY